ncbi:MAG: S8 family serine peptidase [Planctomycetes bacterium]|nr:S8 family serine peptidase [Planctomycetota bacterium]
MATGKEREPESAVCTFILLPRRSHLAQVGLTARVLKDARSEQIRRGFDFRRDDPNQRIVLETLDEFSVRRSGRRAGSRKPRGLAAEAPGSVTGARVVHLTEGEATELRQSADVLVLQDRPMPLIRPESATKGRRARLTEKDLWHLRAIGLKGDKRKKYREGGKGVVVAVLDTGVHAAHPELDGRVQRAVTFDSVSGTPVPQDPSTDTEGHGTHVAGLICGRRVGVAPGALIHSGVMLPQGAGMLSGFILALEWAARSPEVQIVNVSAGIPGFLPEMKDVVADLLAVGVLPVIAVGNEGRNRTRSPGNYNEVLSVGATDPTGRVASFSGGGSLLVENVMYQVPDVVAPGVGVYSCVRGGGYEAWNGTSMSAPIVSGLAALVIERNPRLTVGQILDIVVETAVGLGYPESREGGGLVSLEAAIEAPNLWHN